MITRKTIKSVTKRTNATFDPISRVMTLLSPVLSKQTFIAQHLKLEVITSFVLRCEMFLIFEMFSFICQEQRLSRKLGNQNCSIDLCLLSCYTEGECWQRYTDSFSVHSYQCHVFSRINTEDRLAVRLLVQSGVNETAGWPIWPASLWEALHVNWGSVLLAGPGSWAFHQSDLNSTHWLLEPFPLAHQKIWDITWKIAGVKKNKIGSHGVRPWGKWDTAWIQIKWKKRHFGGWSHSFQNIQPCEKKYLGLYYFTDIRDF